MPNIKEMLSGKVQQFAMIGALVIIIAVFQGLTGNVLSSQNLMNIVMGNAYVLILACGMVMVIIAGHIDLSVGSVAAVIGIVIAKVTFTGGPELSTPVAILIGIALALLIGAWQGFWVAIWGIPAFIVTLAGMLLFRGLNQQIGASLTVPVPEFFQTLGSGYLPDFGREETGLNLMTIGLGVLITVVYLLLEVRKFAAAKADGDKASVSGLVTKVVIAAVLINGVMYVFASGRPGTSFPIAGIVILIVALFYTFLTSRTVLGRSIYAIGGNKAAAELTGVRVKFTNFFVMCNMAFLAGIAAMLFIGRATASGPSDGNLWELDAIAAVFIGGAAVSGGIGTVPGTMIGGLVMAFLNNGLQLYGAGSGTTQITKGLVLLLAVAFDVYSKKQGRRSIIGTFLNARKNQAEILGTPKK